MNLKTYSLTVLSTLIIISGCNKAENNDITPTLSNQEIQTKILTDFSNVVALPLYQDLDLKMNLFYSSCIALDTLTNQANLNAARQSWKNVRAVWEQSEAFLFGPVATDNIDPGSDTWPVDFNALDSLLATSNTFNQAYITTLGDELKGYHPAEYLLWGSNGSKMATDLTPRELAYLTALAADLHMKTTSLFASWHPLNANNYSLEIINAGKPSSSYPSQKAALEEIVNAMIGICDEVANGKIAEPFNLVNPALEESPFSQNSLADFKNNMIGVRNVYYGKYQQDGFGIHDFLNKNNLSLHNNVANQIENAVNSFNAITVPFGQAITAQPTQVNNVVAQINILKNTLETQVLPFIQQTTVN